jgi:hypothetical protein
MKRKFAGHVMQNAGRGIWPKFSGLSHERRDGRSPLLREKCWKQGNVKTVTGRFCMDVNWIDPSWDGVLLWYFLMMVANRFHKKEYYLKSWLINYRVLRKDSEPQSWIVSSNKCQQYQTYWLAASINGNVSFAPNTGGLRKKTNMIMRDRSKHEK